MYSGNKVNINSFLPPFPGYPRFTRSPDGAERILQPDNPRANPMRRRIPCLQDTGWQPAQGIA